MSEALKAGPKSVVILGLGPSLSQFIEITKRLGDRHQYADEVWGINAVGGVLQCDRIFHMDDVRIQEIRAKDKPNSNIGAMLKWMKTHHGPIITSRKHPDYPGLIEFPLEKALNMFGFAYWNNTAAYAVTYAIMLGVEKLSLFGCDYTYPNASDAEAGRACVEFWLGQAGARGIRLVMPKATSLMDSIMEQSARLYGYDMVDVELSAPDKKGNVKVIMTEIAALPTAEEIEARYDHSAHPNPIVRMKQKGGSKNDDEKV